MAFIFGTFGVHQFYLGRRGLGFLHLALLFMTMLANVGFFVQISFFIALATGLGLLFMDQEKFDRKYNRKYLHTLREEGGRRGPTYTRHRSGDRRRAAPTSREEQQRRSTEYRRHREEQARANRRGETYPPTSRERRRDARTTRRSERERGPRFQQVNPHKQEGIKLFKEYDYPGAIREFKQALDIDPTDQAVHFNLACAYSLMEDPQNAMYHIDRLAAMNFQHLDRVETHDALAYLRLQPGFEAFRKNGYRMVAPAPEPPAADAPAAPTPTPSTAAETSTDTEPQPDLLDQLERLAAMRDRGMLTSEEFEIQKRRLLG